MAMMRCKFRLNKVSDARGVADKGVMVEFGAVYEPDDAKRAESENAIFGKYTPHGSFVATIFNPNLVAMLPPLLGQCFYLDFTEAPD
jgi:hypothetical protein